MVQLRNGNQACTEPCFITLDKKSKRGENGGWVLTIVCLLQKHIIDQSGVSNQSRNVHNYVNAEFYIHQDLRYVITNKKKQRYF